MDNEWDTDRLCVVSCGADYRVGSNCVPMGAPSAVTGWEVHFRFKLDDQTYNNLVSPNH